MKQEIKDIISQVKINHIIDIMVELGSAYPVTSRDKRSYIFSSLCHDVSKQKLYCYINDEGISFYCYICCAHYSSIVDLLMDFNKWDFSTAINYIKERCGIRSTYSNRKTGFGSDDLIDDWKLFSKYRTKRKSLFKYDVFDSRVLDLFQRMYYEGWINEGISVEAMKVFNIGYHFKDNAITIPHFDIDNNLIGIRKRNLNQDEVDKGWKYMPVVVQSRMYNHQLGFNLYGLNVNKDTIKRLKKVVIFEAEKSVMIAETLYGRQNNYTCACCGSNISYAQMQILLSLGVEELTICFDRDYESYEDYRYAIFVKKITNIAKLFSPYMKVFVVHEGMTELLDLKDSPIDKGKEVFETLLKNKEYITLGDGKDES